MRRAGTWVMVVAMIGVLVGLMHGCAANQEPAARINQRTEGPQQPQAVTNVTYNVAGDLITGNNSATSRPAFVPGTEDGDGFASAAGSVRPRSIGGSARSGIVSAGTGGLKAHNGNVMVNVVWQDQKGTASPGTGNVNPVTGSIDQPSDLDQKPETQVNPAVPISIGAMPSASASTTSSFKAPATSGQQTFDQSGARNLLQAMGLQPGQVDGVMKLFQSLVSGQGASPATQPGG